MHYDVIIIGAGLSGIAAGMRLAHYGKKVRIFEKHILPGGLNSWYQRGKRIWDVGLHAMTNFVPETIRNAPLPQMLRQLRLKRKDLELMPQSQSVIDFPGQRLILNNDFQAFREQIARQFPQDLKGFDTLCHRLIAYNQYASTQNPPSARAVLQELISSPILREMLICPVLFYGSASPDDMDFARFSILFQSIFKEGFMRPKQGIKGFLEEFLNQFSANGGELSLGNGIAKLIVEQASNKITAAVDTHGETHTAELYLSCAGAPETAALCENLSRQSPLAQAQNSPIGFIETIFQLKYPPKELGLRECITFRNTTEKFAFHSPDANTPVDLRSHLIACPGNYIGCEDIPDACTLRFSALASPQFWFSAAKDVYQKTKKQLAEEITLLLNEKYPHFKESVLSWDMFTPRTITRFTGHQNGAIYGSPNKTPDASTGLENLFLTGSDQGLLGIVGSLISGTVVANAHLN